MINGRTPVFRGKLAETAPSTLVDPFIEHMYDRVSASVMECGDRQFSAENWGAATQNSACRMEGRHRGDVK